MPTYDTDRATNGLTDPTWMAIAKRWHLPHGATGRQYSEAVGRYEAFAAARGEASQPAQPESVAAYIEWRKGAGLGQASLNADARAIRRAHLASGLADPTADPRVRRVLGRRLASRRSSPEARSMVPVDTEPHSMAFDELEQLVGAIRLSEGVLSPPLDVIDAATSRLKAASLAKLTRKRYRDVADKYIAFCKTHDLRPLPAEPSTVCRFLTEYGLTRSPSALNQARAAIKYLHDRANIFPSPTLHPEVKRVVKGHANMFGKPKNPKDALTADQIVAMCEAMDKNGTVIAMRDKAMILTGYSGAFRRSEITARDVHDDDDLPEIFLDIRDIRFTRKGAEVLLRKSKGDQEAKGQRVFITYGSNPDTCAVLALQNWIEFLKKEGIESGPVFPRLVTMGDRLFGFARSGQSSIGGHTLAARLKFWAERIGLDPTRISGHSLRAGHVTVASGNRASLFSIAKQGRWKSLDTVLEYYRRATAHEDNSSSSLGL